MTFLRRDSICKYTGIKLINVIFFFLMFSGRARAAVEVDVERPVAEGGGRRALGW